MIQNLFKLSFVFIGLLFISSCGDDTSILTSDPNISFAGSSGSSDTIKAGEEFTVLLDANKTDADLNGLEVKENGTRVDPSRISFKGSTVGGNPILLQNADRSSFTNLEIKISNSITVGTSNFEFIVLDQDNDVASVTKKVTIEASNPPTLTYNGSDVRSSGIGELVAFNFSATKGTSKILTLEVKQDEITIADITRLSLGANSIISNPAGLDATFHDGFTNQSIIVRSPAIAGTYTYTFIFGDETGNKVSKDVILKAGTALTINGNEVVFNADAPAGSNGALDLDTGKNVPSNSSEAEIQDLGIDANLPPATNWLQKIIGENGADLRLVEKTLLPENFTFNTISYNEEIANVLWPNAGEVIASSPKVLAGNIYVVKKGNKYYSFEITKINNTTGDNLDNYELTIKW